MKMSCFFLPFEVTPAQTITDAGFWYLEPSRSFNGISSLYCRSDHFDDCALPELLI